MIDTTNPLTERTPVNGILEFTTGPNESLGEKVQMLLPNAHVVKAFNSVGSALMVNPKFEQGTPTMFLCGNNPEAKRAVSGDLRAVRMGTVRLRRHRGVARAGAAVYAVVPAGLPAQRLESRLQDADEIKARLDCAGPGLPCRAGLGSGQWTRPT